MIDISSNNDIEKVAEVKKKKSPATIIAAVTAVVVVILVCVIGYFIWKSLQPQPNVLVGMSRSQSDKLKQDQTDNSNKNNIIVSMATEAIFEDGKTDGIINLENVAKNKFVFSVDYILKDGRTVIKTGRIPPGNYLEKAPLIISLPAGDYPASAIYTTYDTAGKEVGKVGVTVTIKVKK